MSDPTVRFRLPGESARRLAVATRLTTPARRGPARVPGHGHAPGVFIAREVCKVASLGKGAGLAPGLPRRAAQSEPG